MGADGINACQICPHLRKIKFFPLFFFRVKQSLFIKQSEDTFLLVENLSRSQHTFPILSLSLLGSQEAFFTSRPSILLKQKKQARKGLYRYTLFFLLFLYSGKCSFHNQTSFTNNSYIPSYRKFFHEKPSERYHQARVFMLRETGTNEL